MKAKKYEAAIAALLTHNTHGAAAAAAGVSEVTLWRWEKDPKFQEAYAAARRRMLDGCLAQLQACVPEAVETIRSVMNSEEASPANKLSAARLILDQGFQAGLVEALENRIAALEEQIAEQAENKQKPRSVT